MKQYSSAAASLYIFQFAFFMLLPKPGGALTQVFLLLYALVSFALYFLLFGFSFGSRWELRKLRKGIIFSVLSFLTFSISLAINQGGAGVASLFAALRPLLFAMMFVLSFALMARAYKMEGGVDDILTKISFAFVVIQFPVVMANAVGVNVFDALYDSEKSKALNDGLRVVGTLANPNFFGFVSCMLSFLFLARRERNRVSHWLLFACLFAFVVLSGSKSAVLVFFIGSVFAFILAANVKLSFRVSAIVFFALILSGILYFLYINKEDFRYLSSLFLLLEGGELEDLKSLSDRFAIWDDAKSLFRQNFGAGTVFWGLGPIELLTSLDNEYLYSFYRWGVSGVFFFYLLWASFAIISSDSQLPNKFVLIFVGSMIIIGLQAETFSSLNYGFVVLHLLPLAGRMGSND